MVVGHHKSVRREIGGRGLLDIDDEIEGYEEFHIGDWRKWSPLAFELLEIDSVSCITEGDEEAYNQALYENRLNMEIPIRYFSVMKMRQSQKGSRPFIIPDRAYSKDMGLEVRLINESNFDINRQ